MNQLLKKEKIHEIYEKGNCKAFSIHITFKEVCDLMNKKDENSIHTPIFQTSLDSDKVNEMVESYNNHPYFMLSKIIITFCIIQCNKNVYYLKNMIKMINFCVYFIILTMKKK